MRNTIIISVVLVCITIITTIYKMNSNRSTPLLCMYCINNNKQQPILKRTVFISTREL